MIAHDNNMLIYKIEHMAEIYLQTDFNAKIVADNDITLLKFATAFNSALPFRIKIVQFGVLLFW